MGTRTICRAEGKARVPHDVATPTVTRSVNAPFGIEGARYKYAHASYWTVSFCTAAFTVDYRTKGEVTMSSIAHTAPDQPSEGVSTLCRPALGECEGLSTEKHQ